MTGPPRHARVPARLPGAAARRAAPRGRRPFDPRVLAEAGALEAALRALPGVAPVSILDAYARARPGPAPPADRAAAEALRRFATGTNFFRRRGLVGVASSASWYSVRRDPGRPRRGARADRRRGGRRPRHAIRSVRRVGGPYLEAWIERESREASQRHFPVFRILVVAVALFLYRSARALLAILLTLAAAVALAAGVGRLLGFSFTVVSAIVPLTVMVTTLASLVYLHSRFVDQPEGVPVDAHQLAALADKFLPVTASSAAAVSGFAALAVSRIRPIREMGLWTAGLAIAWVVAFTLFPALQRALRTPTRRTVEIRARLYDRLAGALPAFTFRWRWPLVAGALGLAAAGLVALAGIPGRLARWASASTCSGTWTRRCPSTRTCGSSGTTSRASTSPASLGAHAARRGHGSRGAARPRSVHLRVEAVPGVVGDRPHLAPAAPPVRGRGARGAAAGARRVRRRGGGLLLTEPELRAFVDVGTLANAQLTVVFERGDGPGVAALARAAREAWDRTAAEGPALRGAERVVGESILAGKVGASLVPTLTESFAITAVLVFAAFLAVFRSASARLLAMIPSLFAILVTFLAMRLAGASLDVATILIATTVLGTTENDQIHFFHHLHEGEDGGLEGALRHTLRVSGRPIVFATFINAAGFLALALSSFPPLRQFGIVTAGAFLLAMLADFTRCRRRSGSRAARRPGAAPDAGSPGRAVIRAPPPLRAARRRSAPPHVEVVQRACIGYGSSVVLRIVRVSIYCPRPGLGAG